MCAITIDRNYLAWTQVMLITCVSQAHTVLSPWDCIMTVWLTSLFCCCCDFSRHTYSGRYGRSSRRAFPASTTITSTSRTRGWSSTVRGRQNFYHWGCRNVQVHCTFFIRRWCCSGILWYYFRWRLKFHLYLPANITALSSE